MNNMGNIPYDWNIKYFNEVLCGGLNKDNNDPRCEPEVKSERKLAICTQCEYFKNYERELAEDARFFGTHIREAIRIFKEAFKK